MTAKTLAKKEFRQELELLKPEVAKVLASRKVSPERMLRIALTLWQTTPALQNCSRDSFYAAVLTSATLGLEPDGVLGQGYIVPFAGRAVFIPGYRGLITLARRNPSVADIKARTVREKDHFAIHYGSEDTIRHVPASPHDKERGKIIGVYSLVWLEGRENPDFEYMDLEAIEKIRDRSPGYKAKSKDSPWTTDFEAMAQKTVLRRHLKRLPLEIHDLEQALAVDEAPERGQVVTLRGDAVQVLEIGDEADKPGDEPVVQQPGETKATAMKRAKAKDDAPPPEAPPELEDEDQEPQEPSGSQEKSQEGAGEAEEPSGTITTDEVKALADLCKREGGKQHARTLWNDLDELIRDEGWEGIANVPESELEDLQRWIIKRARILKQGSEP